MSFLAPMFLFGALAVGLPVVFHLIRRTTRDRKVFSSLMFLNPTPPRLTRRSRLEHIVLLLLRCAVLCLLALGFARPFIKRALASEKASAGAARIVLLVDTSASMRRADLWTEARNRVNSVLGRASPQDRVAVMTFDREVTPVVSFDQWTSAPVSERAARVEASLKDISPGWAATHLGNALVSAAEMLADTGNKPFGGPCHVILISDLQEGSHLDQLQGYEWPKGIDVTVETLKAKHSSNAGLQVVTDAEDTESKTESSVRLRVTNSADSKREQFKVGWAQADGRGFATKPMDIYVPPGQDHVVALPFPAGASTNDQASNLAAMSLNRILLQGDEEDFDNSVFIIPPEKARVSVLYFGAESERDVHQPLYFLQRAFQETRRQTVQEIARSASQPLLASETGFAGLFLATGALPEERAQAIHDQVAIGKTLLFALTTETAGPTLARLLGLSNVQIAEAHPANYAMLADIDFRHPLFAPFADPRFSDFTRIHFWKYRRLDPAAVPGAKVLAKFDSGDPALLEAAVGSGRVLILTSGWQPEDSQLALSTKFVPFLYALLEQSNASAPSPLQYHIGDSVALGSSGSAFGASLSINGPEGAPNVLPAGSTNFSGTLTPGIYTVSETQPPRRFVVNLDAAESRTAPLPADELERLGAPMSHPSIPITRETQRQVRLQNADLEERQKLWRWFIVITLVVLLFETWLAGRARLRQTAQGEVPS